MTRLTRGPLRVALLGAECTGKSTLARELAAALAATGRPAIAVPEYLREWVDARGRTPRIDEQADIAAEQQRRVDAAAAALPDHGVVLADTTGLQTAVYSEFVFGDRSLYAQALDWQRGYALTLLMAPDLPWRPDGLQRDGPEVRAPVDALLRAALATAGVRWSSVHGRGSARRDAARVAIEFAASDRCPSTYSGQTNEYSAVTATSRPLDHPDPASAGRWRGWCERCGDADCEHRLFRRSGLDGPPGAARVTASGGSPADGPAPG